MSLCPHCRKPVEPVGTGLIRDVCEQRDRYRSALAEMSKELSYYPEGDGIFGHLKRILRRALLNK